MRFLKLGMSGDDVSAWQTFLCGGGYNIEVTGTFDAPTEEATKKVQRGFGLTPDGVVGPLSLEKAKSKGFATFVDPSLGPVRPLEFRPVNSTETVDLFGKFTYKAAPTVSNPEAITMDPAWVKDNIVKIARPAFMNHVKGMGSYIFFHKNAAEQLKALLQAWNDAGLIDRITHWGGDWVPRFVRGSRTTLSNHANGGAFDINPYANGLGTVGAKLGEKGCVRELVPLALQHGFWWGGWGFNVNPTAPAGRLDPMHLQFGVVDVPLP